jgi:hypothetical protein
MLFIGIDALSGRKSICEGPAVMAVSALIIILVLLPPIVLLTIRQTAAWAASLIVAAAGQERVNIPLKEPPIPLFPRDTLPLLTRFVTVARYFVHLFRYWLLKQSMQTRLIYRSNSSLINAEIRNIFVSYSTTSFTRNKLCAYISLRAGRGSTDAVMKMFDRRIASSECALLLPSRPMMVGLFAGIERHPHFPDNLRLLLGMELWALWLSRHFLSRWIFAPAIAHEFIHVVQEILGDSLTKEYHSHFQNPHSPKALLSWLNAELDAHIFGSPLLLILAFIPAAVALITLLSAFF